MGMPWTDRLEAVKSHVFDLEGNVAARTESSKRSPGCYTLKDSIKLSRSADPTQQEAALLLIAAVLLKATEGIQDEQKSHIEKDTDVDWQAVWTCAVGPGLELASSLRFALDDANLSVITACAKALRALLSCSANDTVFGLQEACMSRLIALVSQNNHKKQNIATLVFQFSTMSLWPGNKSAFTAPVIRRKTELEEGFIGGGRWKYHVHASDLYPETQLVNPLSDTEEEKDSIGDEVEIVNKDVAAGLLRMDLLTRIQYIFEVEQVRAADEHLLCVVIALARHSPAAAKAVMKCPRLIDSVIQRFLLTDEDLNEGLRPAHTKAIQLLKVLSQASAANCIRFAETGALQVAQSELYKQGFPLPSDPRLGDPSFKGVCATVVECLRLWRVCINHRMGIALFPDIYPALCFWLTPLSLQEISSPTSEDMLFLAQESYSLLERLAWTLPALHTQGSMHVNWTWNVALPLVETASGWLTKERVAAVNAELVKEPHSKHRVMLLATVASVFHFLATVCEMISGDAKQGLHPGVKELAVALASNNLVAFGKGSGGKSMLEILVSFWGRVDEVTAMEVMSCIYGLVRLLRVTDQLYERDGSEKNEILSQGLVNSADGELRGLLNLLGNELLGKKPAGWENVSGPAPGLGCGWGQEGGGVWSNRGLLVNGAARLVTELLEIVPFEADINNKNEELMWRISCCLCVACLFGPGDGDMVHRIYSNVLLHSDTVMLVLQGVNDSNHVYKEISKVLQEHYKKVWIRARPGKSSQVGNRKKPKTSLIATKLSNLSEESAKLAEEKLGMEGFSVDMLTEWAKQRLPLTPQSVLSPMAINLTGGNGPECKMLSDGTFVVGQDEMEDAMEYGVVWLLGLEVLSQSTSNDSNVFAAIPVVRKVHALSCLFLLGGDVFRRKSVKSYIGELQRLYGILFEAKTPSGVIRLDFEGEIDEGYCGFVEALVKKFSKEASGDAGFGSQVALYLRTDVAVSIRLQTWRALAAAEAFDLLPALPDCPGDPSGYLFPSEKNMEMFEAFVSALTTGKLSLVDGKSSVASTLTLHHLAAFLFEENSATDEALLHKTAKALFDISKPTPKQHQDFLRKLVECSLSWPAKSVKSEELERRLSFIQKLCEGDDVVTNRVRDLRDILLQSSHS